MAWAILGLVLVVGVISWLLGNGHFGSQPDVVDDRPVPRLPEGDFTAADVRALHFATVPRGYHPRQVRALLTRVARCLDAPDETPAQASDEPIEEAVRVTAREVAESSFSLVAFGVSTSQVDEVLARLSWQLSERPVGAEAPRYGRMGDEHLPGTSEEVHTWQQ
ncbi:DivIVA domain-containing protein [Aestuariimicrobium kwangyangense]|uniref:DivIVA domain-containing protein n=1 Tax=Aestuariimicrobium kwangyangense TaxID=396389 RepID=UPI0003B62A6C|nr:DivIVA domain-containing protein [Aestuariimicrobium kwangyangense]